MKNKKIVKILFFLSIFINSAFGSVILIDKTNKIDRFQIEYLYDENSKFTIEDIEKKSFKETIPNQFTKGYKYGNAWFKIDITNKSNDEEFVLYFTESIWSTLDLYTKKESQWSIQKNGLNVPLKLREIQDSSPAFKLNIAKNETITLYLKGQTIASQLGEFQIFTKNEYFNPNRITLSQWYIIYAFVLFSFILLNLYNLVMTRESIYAYYLLYVFVFIVFISMHSGIYINFGFPNWEEGLHTLGQVTLVCLLLFSKEFLELKKTYPKMEKVFFRLAIGAFIFAILLSQNIPYATIVSNLYFCIVLITIVYTAVIVLKRGFEGAKYYLTALMLYLPSMTLMAMNFNALLPNSDITRYSFLGGAFLEIFLFTLILTNRYKYISELNSRLTQKTNELEIAKEQLKKDSITDFLTGIYNRRYFNEIFSVIINSAKRKNDLVSFIILDIDYFKQYNDTYGHHAGDEVLIQVADTIKSSLKRADDYCFRLGGEEFGVIFNAETKQKAEEFAENMRRNIESLHIEHTRNNASKYVTASLGLVCKKANDIPNEDEIYKKADDLLYKAKALGRNRIIVEL